MLHYGLNIRISFEDLKSKDEKSLESFLENFEKPSKPSYNLTIPKQAYEYPENAGKKTDLMILPLSIDDEATTCGTASILQNYSKEFNIHCAPSSNYIPKDRTTGKFNLSAARERFIFYQGLKDHHEEMKLFRTTLENQEKHIIDDHEEYCLDADESDSDVDVVDKNRSQQLSFKQRCANLEQKMANAMEELRGCTNGENLQQSARILKQNQGTWFIVEDQFGRTCLQVAVEENEIYLAESLLVSGAEVNRPEGCGVTPLMTAVIKEQLGMAQLLLKYNAKTHGTFAGLIPSPLELVESVDNAALKSTILHHISQEVKEEVAIFTEYLGQEEVETNNITELQHGQERASCDEVINARKRVITFGDQKTCSNIRAVRNRAPDEFSAFTEKPGDFHTEGYLAQCCAKMLGPGGFYYVVRMLLGRQRVTSKSFQKIFKEGNLERGIDALKDFTWGLAIAVVKEFEKSAYFPSKDTLNHSQNPTDLLCNRFQGWLEESSKDAVFSYNKQNLFDHLFLLDFFHSSVRLGNGKALESCYFLLAPIFFAMNKKNYKDEAFVHIVNIVSNWPLALRETLRRNRTVSLSGRPGHDLADDEFIEERLVRRTKIYAKKQATIQGLERISLILDFCAELESLFKSSYNVKTRKKTSVPDSTADHIKVAWFATKEEWFCDKGRTEVLSYPSNKKELPAVKQKLRKDCQNVPLRGKELFKKHFKEMRCRLFPTTALNFLNNDTYP